MSNSKTLTGAEVAAKFLEERGVEVVFAITGAGNLALLDAILTLTDIRIIYSHHEQSAVMEAQGYSRVTGKVGVAVVTTGGGASNAVTGVLSAHLDSVAIVVISGNESSFHISNMANFRAYGVQGFDSCEVMKPITKFSERILRPQQILRIFQMSWGEAVNRRQGPVFIDFPMDLQRGKVNSEDLENDGTFGSPCNPVVDSKTEASLIHDLAHLLCRASRPLFYFGNGIRNSDASSLASDLVRRYRLPYAVSWSALDLFDDRDELNVGRIGIYGDRAANIILQKSDLFVSIGSRLAIPQVGYDKLDFGRNAIKVVVDIDEVELKKFAGDDWVLVHQDATAFLHELTKRLADLGMPSTSSIWSNEISNIWRALPRIQQVGKTNLDTQTIHSADVMSYLNERLEDDATVVTDVGAGLLTGHYMLSPKKNQRLFTSQGLGEMGFGLPGAIGAYFGKPDSQLVCLNTDGGIMFNLQELQVVKHHSIPMKLLIFNNSGYSMIKVSQENLFDGRHFGVSQDTGVSFPNFRELAHLFSMSYYRVAEVSELDNLGTALSAAGSALIEIVMSPSQKYFPRLATNKLENGRLISPPLEDLDPRIPIEDLEKLLGYRAHRASYELRGLDYA